VLHALNMFNSPSWLAAGQEGALVARAWSLLQGRELWGDLVTHAPGGVLLLSGWLAVMGGFGALPDSGRLLMLLLHVASVLLLYGLGRLLGCGALGATVAAGLFAVSPLAIAHQRLVVPDNFVTFWVLLGFYLLLRPGAWPGRLAGALCLMLGFFSFDAASAAASAEGASLQSLLNAVNEPLIALGAAAAFANLLRARHDLRAALVGVAGAIAILRVSAGPPEAASALELVIPLCLNIGLVIGPALGRLPLPLGRAACAAVLGVYVVQYAAVGAFQPLFVQRPTSAERAALA